MIQKHEKVLVLGIIIEGRISGQRATGVINNMYYATAGRNVDGVESYG